MGHGTWPLSCAYSPPFRSCLSDRGDGSLVPAVVPDQADQATDHVLAGYQSVRRPQRQEGQPVGCLVRAIGEAVDYEF
jgi:hypothetical protein